MPASSSSNVELRISHRNTIFALATPAHPSPVALLRISGPQTAAVTLALCGAPMRRASIECEIALPVGRVPAGAWILPGPHTLTGEDTLELRVPGNPTIVRQLEQRLIELGCRFADPGEFTRRALDAAKLDLSKAEAVLSLINAVTEAARRQAVADLSGHTAAAVGALAERLRAISARFEMSFDFSEEEHVEVEHHRLLGDLADVTRELSEVVDGGEMPPLRERPVIAVFGPPNAGKSSLFNALVGTPRALVSEVPGTTRDPVEAPCAFGTHDATLVDLSGVGKLDADRGRFAETARARALQADVVLVLEAPGQSNEALLGFRELESRDPGVRTRSLRVITMADVRPQHAASGDSPASPFDGGLSSLDAVFVSAISGGGLEELRARIAARLDLLASGGATSLLRLRTHEALKLLQIEPAAPPEVIASDVRRALVLLDQALLSEVPGEVLDLIFSRFCIGK
jgi:tRNA modification GTPase